jgi:hypothetical protein
MLESRGKKFTSSTHQSRKINDTTAAETVAEEACSTMSRDFLGQSKWVKTRKKHICELCGGPIPIGEEVHYNTGVYDGVFFASYTHRECWESYIKSGDEEYSCWDAPWPERINEWWKEHEQEWRKPDSVVKI